MFRALTAKGKFYIAVYFHTGEHHSLGGRIEVSSIQSPQVRNGVFIPSVVIVVQDQ